MENICAHLPCRADFIEMLGRARAVTAEALAQAEPAANYSLLQQYQWQLANWNWLIQQVQAAFSATNNHQNCRVTSERRASRLPRFF